MKRLDQEAVTGAMETDLSQSQAAPSGRSRDLVEVVTYTQGEMVFAASDARKHHVAVVMRLRFVQESNPRPRGGALKPSAQNRIRRMLRMV